MVKTVRVLCVAGMLAVLAGCASYDGRGLIAGRSTGAEVQNLMGMPAERLANADGSSTWFYPRGPLGRHTYAVTVGADGTMRGIEQRLTQENMKLLVRGETTAKQARAIFGPPNRIVRAARFPVDVWEYRTLDFQDKRVMWMEFSDDGVLRNVFESHDFESDEPSGPAMP